jgi:predicted ATPase
VLSHDGGDLAAALQTISEVGAGAELESAVASAFPGSSVAIAPADDGRLSVQFSQHGLLRPLSAAELPDGTLRYLLWTAALLSPRPPGLLVLNEPETSLHPDLLPALGQLIAGAATRTQVIVVSHSAVLIDAIARGASRAETELTAVELVKKFGQTTVADREPLDQPPWHWPKR